MSSILDEIINHKRQVELPSRKKNVPLSQVQRLAEQSATPRDFARALRRADGNVALIAEVKRASPSKGDLVKGEFLPTQVAQTYQANGASAISVLTDEKYFRGSLDYLRAIKAAVDLPILRKDFIVDAYQIYEARAAGADAILLIAAVLDDAVLRDLQMLAHELHLMALLEVHDENETERALRVGATVIGVNNRNLHTFVTDLQTTEKCAAVTRGTDITLVSESGIFTSQDVRRVADYGAHAILVGESLITSLDMAVQTRLLACVQRA